MLWLILCLVIVAYTSNVCINCIQKNMCFLCSFLNFVFSVLANTLAGKSVCLKWPILGVGNGLVYSWLLSVVSVLCVCLCVITTWRLFASLLTECIACNFFICIPAVFPTIMCVRKNVCYCDISLGKLLRYILHKLTHSVLVTWRILTT